MMRTVRYDAGQVSRIHVQPHSKSFGTSGPNSRGSPFCFVILIFETVVRESCNVSIAAIPVNRLSMRECHGCWWATTHEQLNILGCQYFSNAAVRVKFIKHVSMLRAPTRLSICVLLRPYIHI
jgi:hypothetical protein